MSSLYSAIRDDIQGYIELCHMYNEGVVFSPVRGGGLVEDCYGDHAKALLKRFKQQFPKEWPPIKI